MENSKHWRNTIAVLVATLIALIALIISLAFQFDTVRNLILGWVLTTAFSIFAIFLVDPRIVRREQVERVVYVDKPVIRETQIQVPVENKTIEVITPEIRKVPVYIDREVIRTVRTKCRRRKLNIPKYKFIGSSETKRFHKKTCRLSRIIKNKYKIQTNSQAFFKRKHFKQCKICLKKN